MPLLPELFFGNSEEMAMSFPVVVDCQPGHGSEPMPHALHFGLARVALKALVDRRDGGTAVASSAWATSGLLAFAFCDGGRGAAR
jgi:hypothetical protein